MRIALALLILLGSLSASASESDDTKALAGQPLACAKDHHGVAFDRDQPLSLKGLQDSADHFS